MTARSGNNSSNVDKGVCTNDVLEDLHRAIKFEAVFSTLIENKILSIKRECEEKRKQKRSLARFLFGGRRRNVASTTVDPNIEAFPEDSNGNATSAGGEGEARGGGQWCSMAQENEKLQPSLDQMGTDGGGVGVAETAFAGGSETVLLDGNKSGECTTLYRGGCGVPRQPELNPEFEYKYDAISIQSDTCRTTSLCMSNDIMFTAKRRHPHPQLQQQMQPQSAGGMRLPPKRDKRSQSDDFIARSNHRCPPPTQFHSRSAATRKYPVHDDRLSIGIGTPPQQKPPPNAPGSKSALTSSSSSLLSNPTTTANDDGSQIKSQGAKVCHSPNKDNNCNNNSSVSESGAVKLSPREASVLLEQERHRLRIFEQRSISAQCSPIMPRHIEFEGIVSLSNSAPISLNPVQDLNGEQTCAAGTDRGMLDATPVKSHRRHNHKSKSQRAAEYLASQIDFDSLASYPLVNPKTQGIISSFNHLKSPNLPTVIPMRQPQTQNGDLQLSTTTSSARSQKKGDLPSQITAAGATTTTTTTTGVGGDGMQQVVNVGGKSNRKGGRSTAAGGQTKGNRDEDNNEPRQSSE